MFIEITADAFDALLGDKQGSPNAVIYSAGARIAVYSVHGVELKEITNFYSQSVTQYYAKDINA